MTTLYIGKTSPYLGTVLSHPYLYLDMNDKKKVVHVIYIYMYLTLGIYLGNWSVPGMFSSLLF